MESHGYRFNDFVDFLGGYEFLNKKYPNPGSNNR